MSVNNLGQVWSSVPWDSPAKNKGGYMYEPLNQWAYFNLGNMLYDTSTWQGVGTPFGNNFDQWKAATDTDYAGYAYNAGLNGGENAISATPFRADVSGLQYTPEQLKQFLGADGANVLQGPDGNWFYRTKLNDPDKDGGLFNNALGSAFGFGAMGAMAGLAGGLGGLESGLGGAAGLEAGALAGAPGYGAALESSLAGLGAGAGGLGADASWGVNPQGAGNMGWDYGDFLNSIGIDPSSTQFAGGGSIYDATGGVLNDLGSYAMNDLSAGPGKLNLQDLITKFDSLPPGVGTAAKTILGKVLGGNGTQEDWTKLLGVLGSTGLGVLGSNNQANALTNIANQSRADRQPFLNKSLEWLNDPAAYAAGPGKAALDATLRGLSVNGNPFGSATSLALAGDIANRNWQNAVTGFGNLGLAGQDSRNSLLASAAGADRGVTASLASGLGSLTTPDTSLESMLRRLQSTGLA